MGTFFLAAPNWATALGAAAAASQFGRARGVTDLWLTISTKRTKQQMMLLAMFLLVFVVIIWGFSYFSWHLHSFLSFFISFWLPNNSVE